VVSSIASTATLGYTATLAYNAATTTSGANNPSGAATSGVAKAAASAGPASAVTVITLSPNAQRLQTATNNLTALENGGTNLAGVWNKDYQQAGNLGIDQEQGADAEIAALPASDPAHITQATAAQAFVKANIAAAGTASGGQPVSAPNPFAGASTQTLAAVISDKSGLYTGYEKAAAVYEYQNQQNAWVDEYGPGNPINDNAAGKANYYSKVISTYNALPSLIQASYPANYVQSIIPLQQFYASGKDDNDLPSFFGKSSSAQETALIILQGLTKNTTSDKSSAPSS
jgi:hypothetical protein